MVTMKNSILSRYRHCSGLGRESGVALIMALICLFVMSTLAVGVLYSTQSEVWTTANYRAVTQARYVAEAGAQQALNYLQTLNLAGTVPIASSAKFTTTNFNYATGMPVMYTPAACTGGPYTPPYTATACRPVIMATSGMSGTKYPDTQAAIDTALVTTFDTNFQAAFTTAVTQTPFNGLSNCSGSSCPQFNVAVQLLTAYPNGTGWVTRWKIVSEGSLNTIGSSTSGGKALVQVVEIVDNVMVAASGGSSAPNYVAGVFATGTGCGSITMSGGVTTSAFSSTAQPGVLNPTLTAGGSVATMGNINLSGSASIAGNVYSPFYNTGTAGTYGISGGPYPGLNGSAACSTSGGTEYAVNEDNSGSGVGCTSEMTACSQKTYPIPSPAPSNATPIMPTVTEPSASYSVSGGATVSPLPLTPTGYTGYGAVSFSGGSTVVLQAGTYNFDSLTVSGGAVIELPTTGTVVINILNQKGTGTPINFSGGTVANKTTAGAAGVPGNFTIVYGGTNPINLSGGATMFATVYAPNAPVTISGAGALDGALVCKTANFSGSGTVNYDTSLANKPINVNTGPPPTQPGALHIDEFSWSAF